MGAFFIETSLTSDIKGQRIVGGVLASHLLGWLTMSAMTFVLFRAFSSPMGYLFLLKTHHLQFQLLLVPLVFLISVPLSVAAAKKCAKHGFFSVGASLVVGPLIGIFSSVPLVMLAALLQVRVLFFDAIVQDLHWTGVTLFATAIAALYGWQCSSWFWLLIGRLEDSALESERSGYTPFGKALAITAILVSPPILVALALWVIQWFSMWFFP